MRPDRRPVGRPGNVDLEGVLTVLIGAQLVGGIDRLGQAGACIGIPVPKHRFRVGARIGVGEDFQRFGAIDISVSKSLFATLRHNFKL